VLTVFDSVVIGVCAFPRTLWKNRLPTDSRPSTDLLLHSQVGGVMSELLYSPAAYGLDMSVRNMPKPRARISPQVSAWGAGLLTRLSGGVLC
jgi:hypothetical protein